MIPARLHRVVQALRAAAVAGIAGFALLATAVAVASLRYGVCGPSTLHAADAGCATGARLLVAACIVLSIALVLGAASLTLLWRERRGRRAPRG